jgi:ArsR family transcriptional regulator
MYLPESGWFIRDAGRDAVMAKTSAASDHGTKPAWTEQAQLLRVMAHPLRLMVLEALADRSQCVKELNSLVPIIQPQLSQHIAALRKAKLVDCHARGTLRCYYLLRPTLVRRMIRLLREKHPVRARSRDSILREIQQTTGRHESGERGAGGLRTTGWSRPRLWPRRNVRPR